MNQRLKKQPLDTFFNKEASLIDLQIWRKLRKLDSKFNILEYIMLEIIYHDRCMFSNVGEFSEWLYNGNYEEKKFLCRGQIARQYNLDNSTVFRHYKRLERKGFIFKGEYSTLLSDEMKLLFDQSIKDINHEDILIFDSLYAEECKSMEEALVLFYILKRHPNMDSKTIKAMKASDIKKSLLLDIKTIKRALVNWEDKLAKIDEADILSICRIFNIFHRHRMFKRYYINHGKSAI